MKESRRREKERAMARARQSAVAVDAGEGLWMLIGCGGEQRVRIKHLETGFLGCDWIKVN